MADDGGFAPPPTGQKLVALHKCVQGCPAQQQFQPSFPGQAQFPGQTAIALGPPPPIGKVKNILHEDPFLQYLNSDFLF